MILTLNYFKNILYNSHQIKMKYYLKLIRIENLLLIALMQLVIKYTFLNQADILQAYQNLERGSQNHLRSFNRMLQRNGWQYQPQYISLEKFQQIIAGNNKNGR